MQEKKEKERIESNDEIAPEGKVSSMDEVGAVKALLLFDLPYILSMPVVLMLCFIFGTYYFSEVAWKKLYMAFVTFMGVFLAWIISTASMTKLLLEHGEIWDALGLLSYYWLPIVLNRTLNEVLSPDERGLLKGVNYAYGVVFLWACVLEASGGQGLQREMVLYFPLVLVLQLCVTVRFVRAARDGNHAARMALLPLLGVSALCVWEGFCACLYPVEWHAVILPLSVYSAVCFALWLFKEQLMQERKLLRRARGLKREIRQARELSERDELTKCRNRVAFDRRLERMMYPEEGRPVPFSILMLDVDHFKSVNDNFGHDTGDKVLIGFSRAVQQILSGEQVLYRWGGEEFFILCPGQGLEEAALLAERIRSGVAGTDILPQQPVTVSIGVAQWKGPGERIGILLERTDAALYRAKERGRNRVEMEK